VDTPDLVVLVDLLDPADLVDLRENVDPKAIAVMMVPMPAHTPNMSTPADPIKLTIMLKTSSSKEVVLVL